MCIIIIYAFIILIILIFINKKIEGYTFIPNLNFNEIYKRNPILTIDDIKVSTCMKHCDTYDNNDSNGCSGFISNIPNNANSSGTCKFYGNDVLNINNLQHMTYVDQYANPKNSNNLYPSNLYIK